jgi:hypothetical protein
MHDDAAKHFMSSISIGRRTWVRAAVASLLSARATAGAAQPATQELPAVTLLQGVRTAAEDWQGHRALAVELTEAEQARVLARGGNGPNYAVLDTDFTDGVIEADVAGEINGKGASDVRAFVGVAFHLSADLLTYEAVYLRMSNGTLNNPPPPSPRDARAIQYVAHPDFHYFVSREKFPGLYERPAPIALGRWHRLRLEIKGRRLRALVDGGEVLVVDDLKYAGRTGRVGLWVDDGTRGHFAGVRITREA